MYADRLQYGDKIRIIAPSRSIQAVHQNCFNSSLEFLNSKGYNITFSAHCDEIEYAKTGLITYHGPFFCSFAFKNNRDYSNKHFEKCVMQNSEYSLIPSAEAKKYEIINPGICEGKIIGGNLCTLNLLQGTEFMPNMKDVILFIEDDNIMGEYFVQEFERNLQSLLQLKDCTIKGVVFGRFAKNCNMTKDAITNIVKNKKQLKNIPIISNVDFGHITLFATFPIGGIAKIVAENDDVDIIIKEH